MHYHWVVDPKQAIATAILFENYACLDFLVPIQHMIYLYLYQYVNVQKNLIFVFGDHRVTLGSVECVDLLGII